MKTPKIVNAIGHIDDELVCGAVAENKKKNNTWVKWGSLAACFTVLAVAGAVVIPKLTVGNSGKYKDYAYTYESAAYVWRWEYRTVSEKYTETELNGVKYHLRSSREISGDIIGEEIGVFDVVGYDIYSEEIKSEKFHAYSIKNVGQEQCVAINMDGKYYVFSNDEHSFPKTLGELFEKASLPDIVELSYFSENGDDPNDSHFTLKNDDYVWELLADCTDAPFVSDDNWFVHERDYISFTVTAEAVGAYKNAMYITSDGYLWTNMFSYGYLFDIGEDTAGDIIEYSMKNSEAAEFRPYENYVVGTITSITDGYIAIDDSVICNDVSDRNIYKVSLDNIRITRYIDNGFIKVGDTVRVVYTGVTGEDNTITGASSIDEIVLHFGNDDNDKPDDLNEKPVSATTSKAYSEPIAE